MDLFLEKDKGMEKQARMYVSEDPNKWVKEVMLAFLERYPQLQEEPSLLEWKKRETKKGYGVGMIKILGGAVPVVIREFQLYPMDMFVVGNQYLPLNNQIVEMLLHSPDAFEEIAKPSGTSTQLFDPELSDSSFSPTNIGRFGSGSGLSEIRPAKTASVLERISTVNKEDVDEIMNIVESDPVIKRTFKTNETYEVLEKLANKPALSAESEKEAFLRNLEVDRQYVYSDGFGNTFVKQANHAIDKVWEVRISRDEVSEHPLALAEDRLEKKASVTLKEAIFPVIGQDYFLSIDESKQYTKQAEWNEKRASYVELEEKTPEVGDFGVFLGSNGCTEPFTVEKSAKSYKFEKKASNESISAVRLLGSPDKMLVFDENSNWSVVEDSYEKKADVNTQIEATNPKLGDFGYFLTPEGATEPFEVRNMQKVANFDYVYVSGDCGLDKVAYYIVRKGVKDSIQPHETEKNAYYLNRDARFVKLSSFNEDLNRNWKRYKDSLGDISVLGSQGIKVASYKIDFEADSDEIEKISEEVYRVPHNAKFIKLSHKREEKTEVSPHQHYVGKDDVGFYYLRGRQFEKYASNGHKLRDLDQNEAAWAVIHCGGTKNDLKKIASLQNKEVRPLEGKISSPRPAEQVLDLVKKAYDQTNVKFPKLNKKLVKEASVLTDKTSVDSILSLGLINKNNISEFLDAIPVYEQVMSSLAKLLLMSRLGLSVSSLEIKKAMDSVSNVLLILRQIKSLIKPTK
jgi:hypothetical protein